MHLAREEMDCFREQLQEAEAWLKSLDHPTPDVTKLLGNKTLREIRFAFGHVQAGSTHSAKIASDVLAKAVRLPYDLQDAVNCTEPADHTTTRERECN